MTTHARPAVGPAPTLPRVETTVLHQDLARGCVEFRNKRDRGTRAPVRAAAGAALALLAACGGKTDTAAPTVTAATEAPKPAALQSTDLKPGDGEPIGAGKMAVVQYTGWLYEAGAQDRKGKEFDSSRNSGQPFSFTVGAGQVIKGWDQGVVGMKVGGSRRLVIPPDLAYGDAGVGPIPPGATLVFDIDLIRIE